MDKKELYKITLISREDREMQVNFFLPISELSNFLAGQIFDWMKDDLVIQID